MRNFKFLATAIVAMMLACVLAFSSFAAKTPFTDVDDKNETLSDAVSLLAGIGVTKGVSETKFGTMDLVTREQMAAFVYRLMKNGKTLEGGSNTTPFKDLTDSTYFGYVSWANGLGIIKGTSTTTFNPKGGIILQDAYTMVVRALGHETDSYIYPFTYTDKAEELGLDVGLDSVVGYTTKLTRGDVAIILYNAFFAETGKEEVKQTEKFIGDPYNGKWVLEEKTYNPTLAEDVYDVEVGNFTVRATPKYAFNESEGSTEYIPLCDDYEDEMLHLVAAEDDEALHEMYCEFSETGLSGKADDYIMRGVEVFYTYTTKNEKRTLDKVYFVNSAHSLIETNSVTYYREDGKNDDEFYHYTRGNKNGNKSSYKKLKGYFTVSGKDIYFFDAPYSYLKPTFPTGLTKDQRDELQNEKNVKLIDIKCLDSAKGTYSYYIDESKPVNDADSLHKNLDRVFSTGVYKIKFYDVDGDGIYEYAHYMPATYGFMDGDDNKIFSTDMTKNGPVRDEFKGSELDLKFKPTIYYNDAELRGKDFEDGDMVLAYLNPAANFIEVMAVVEPYNGFVSQVKPKNAWFKIDNIGFATHLSYRVVMDFYDGNDTKYNQYNLLDNPASSNYDFFTRSDYSSGGGTGGSGTFPVLIGDAYDAVGEVFDIYAYKVPGLSTCVLWYDHIEDAQISFGLDELAIPVSDEDHPAQTYTESNFNAELGENVQFAKMYYNGKISYLPLNLEEMYPAFDAGKEGSVYNIADVKKNGVPCYLDKICKVTVDNNGLYTLIPLLHAEDDEGEYIGINNDSSTLVEEDNNKQYGLDLDKQATGTIKKVAGTRFALEDATGSLLGDPFGDGPSIKYFNITGATRIIIKNWLSEEREEYEFLEFNSTNFKASSSNELGNIQYILKGIPDSTTTADLVLLYAEAVEFEFDTKSVDNGWRIVADSEINKDAEGDYRNFYKLFNPYTGTIEENVSGIVYDAKASKLDAALAVGTVVELKNGMVDEESEDLGLIDTSEPTGLVYLTEFVEEDGYLGFVPVEAVENAIADETICCGEDLDNFVAEYKYDGVELNFDGEEFKLTVDRDGDVNYGTALYYEVNEDTVISVLTSEESGKKAILEGEYKLADVSAIAKAGKEFKCYNENVLNRKGEYVTAYADYVKAYVYSAKDAKREDTLPVAEYIIIVVNGDEERIFSDSDDNFLPRTHAE